MHTRLEELTIGPGHPLAHRVRRAALTNSDGAPCLLLLHGVGSNEESLIDLALEQDPRLTVILVRAPLVLGARQFAWFNVNFASGSPSINPAQAEGSRRLLAGFIRTLAASYSVDPAKVWIAGFSQGGIMSASVGLTHPELVSGFGILSGRILPEIDPLIPDLRQSGGPGAFISHGLHDGKLTIEFARNARQKLEGLGIHPSYQEYEAGHELNRAMRADFQRWIAKELDASTPASAA